jgi:hypothetical protein
LYQTDNRTNNTTVPHEDPEEVEQENRLDRLASYLSGDLNGRIGESSLQLSQDEYEAARAALGDDYSDSLGKYVDVEGETDGEGASDAYETVQSTQREYVDTVSEFRETRREYEEARQAGEDGRARELARELARLAADGESQSDRLTDLYGRIGNRTGADLAESSDRILAVQSTLSAQRDEIVAREFIETRLVVRSATRDISFRNPLVVSGTLETVNGTPVDADRARFAVGERVIRTGLASNGTFEFAYRPATIDADTTTLTVEYRPPGSSVYLTSNETVPVNITQVTVPARASAPANATYGYADSVAVDAVIDVNGTAVPNYPLVASLAGTSLSTARTNGRGESTLAGTVPASVQAGEATVRVKGDREDRAVRVQPATVPVSIVSTTTALTADARATATGSVVVDGRLSTGDGDAVDRQSVAISLNGRTLETTTTGASGQYRGTVDPPPNVSVDNATVVVSFDGSGTNLESANASSDVTVTNATAQGEPGDDRSPIERFLGSPSGGLDSAWTGLFVVLVLFVVVLYFRRRSAETDAEATEMAETAGTDTTSSDPAEPTGTDASASILQSATETLSEGYPNDAVVTAYAGVRGALEDRVAVGTSSTHWEFYRQCLEQGVDQEEPLKSLTRGYEKAAYSGLTLSADDAEAVIETARLLLDTSDPD